MRSARLLSIVFLASLASAFAQTTSTAILGTVTDVSGAVVQGAKVTALQTNTGNKREDTTNASGDYNFPLIDVGQYEVTVEMPGFKTESRKNITLILDQKARLDFRLEVGAQTERVEISSDAPLLQTDEASLGQVVTAKQIEELPLNGRNIAGLAVLQPGVQFGGRMGFDGLSGGGGGVPVPGAGISLSANGQRDTNQHATLDGVIATEARVNTVPFTPSIEAIEEFKVQAGSYSAEYGMNSGAQLTMVLKSGSNQYHGSAFEFIRNDAFDATDYFQNYFNAPGAKLNPKNRLRQNQFGGVLGGPISIPKLYNGKDKTFFMVDYEQKRRRQPGGASAINVPSLAFRQGDLSALLNRTDANGKPLPAIQVVDPITGAPFPGNIIPASRIQPAAIALLKFYPEPQRINSDPLNGVNYIGAGNIKLTDEQVFTRIDHNFSDRNKLFGHYAYDDIDYATTPVNPNFQYLVAGRNQNVAFHFLHIFSPSLINEFLFGYNRSVDNTLNPRSNTNFDYDTLGLTGFRVVTDNNRKFTPREAGLLPVNIDNFAGLGDQDGGNGFDFNNLGQFSDNVTINRGAHNFKTGFDYVRVALNRGAANVPRGDLNFNDVIGNSGFASFLLGYPGSSDTPEGLPLTDSRQNRYGAYFLDDWKFSQKLTLNLGLRYEYNSTATDIKGLWRSLSFAQETNGIPTLIPNIRTPYHFYNPEKKLFMPRVGLAYRLNDKMVVRAGYGIYYNVEQLNNYTILNLNPPLSGSSNFSTQATNGVLNKNQTILTYASPFGAIDNTRLTNANTLNPNNLEPRTHQWSLDYQTQLPFNAVLSLGYVGSKGVHIDNTVELNNPDPGLSSGPSVQSRRPYQYVIDGVGGPVRPLSRIRWLDSGSNSWYHGLQVNANKRLSHGLLVNVAYTFSKAEGEGYGRNEGFGAIVNTYQSPRNRAAEKARYPFDVKHNAVISFLYEVPGPMRNVFLREAAHGWQVNGIWTIRSGFPFTVQQSNTLNTANSSVRPDRLANGSLANPTVNEWFDPGAFRLVTCQFDYLANRCHYGNSGQGILDGPGFNSLDLSAFKNFAITERAKLQIRVEAFNIANHPNFNTPNATLTSSRAFLPNQDPVTGALGPDPIQTGRVQGPGAITSLVSPMRIVQFGAKIIF